MASFIKQPNVILIVRITPRLYRELLRLLPPAGLHHDGGRADVTVYSPRTRMATATPGGRRHARYYHTRGRTSIERGELTLVIFNDVPRQMTYDIRHDTLYVEVRLSDVEDIRLIVTSSRRRNKTWGVKITLIATSCDRRFTGCYRVRWQIRP